MLATYCVYKYRYNQRVNNKNVLLIFTIDTIKKLKIIHWALDNIYGMFIDIIIIHTYNVS